MTRTLAAAILAAAALAALAATPAGAASVAYIDGNNLWLSSPDGADKFQVTSNGTDDQRWSWPAQGPDGKTVAVLQKTLFLFGADGKQVIANVMPVYSGATIPVYPIGLDMDSKSQAVAYGYSYCGFACNQVYQGFWLTFSDNQGLYPSDPQGQSDAHFPTFFGTRVVSSDSGGNIFVQPDVPEAPFTNSYQGWLDATPSLTRVAVAPTGRLVAIEWSDGTNEGILVGQHQGTVPSDVTELCDLPVGASSANVSFSPDGTQIAWADNGGVKVAGVPNLAAGTPECQLSSPVRVLSATGHTPDFGGADVASILGKNGPGPGPGPNGHLAASLTGKRTWGTFVQKGLTLRVKVPRSGRVDGSATAPRKVAGAAGVAASRSTAVSALISGGGFAAARAVVVARGHVTAKRAGAVTLKLKPTRAARRAGRKLKGVKLAVKISQGSVRGSLSVKLR